MKLFSLHPAPHVRSSALLALGLCGTVTPVACSKASSDPVSNIANVNASGSAGMADSSGGAAGSLAAAGTVGSTAGGGAANAGSAGSNGGAGIGASGSAGAVGNAGAGGNAGAAGADGTDAGVAAGPPFGHPSPLATHPSYPGFTLWVVEDFDQPLDLDQDPIWTWSDGGFQIHRFTRDAITFANGAMSITFSETPQPESCSHSNQGIVPARTRTSGELRSRHNLFRYGRYETRIKAPSVQPNDPVINGNYIASLFIFRQPACQEWREIDLEITGDTPEHFVTNVIHGDNTCGTTEQVQHLDLAGIDFRVDFQTIGFEWLPGAVRYYYMDANGDEVTTRELMDDRVPSLPAKIMANLWVFQGGFAFGGPDGQNNVFPLHSEYDFIRFYKWDGDANYPCEAMDTSCLSAADTDLGGNNGCDGIVNVGDLTNCPQCGATVHVACAAECP